MIDTKQLTYFIAVAETGGFKSAAERCCITQSAISQQIKALEERVGASLFFRDTHSTGLTDAGKELLPYAHKVVAAAQDCEEHMASLNGVLFGTLNLGVGSFIEPYIRRAGIIMMKRYPGVKINAVFSQPKILNNMLVNHELDIAFTMNTAYSTENIDSIPAIPFKVKAVMSRRHRLATKKLITPEDILTSDVALPDMGERVFNSVRKYVDIDTEALRNRCRLVANAPDAVLNGIEDLDFITFLPEIYVERYPNLTAIPIDGMEKPFVSNAHFLSNCSRKKIAEVFLDIVRNECVPYFENIYKHE